MSFQSKSYAAKEIKFQGGVVTDARLSLRILLRFRQPIKALLSSLKILIKKEVFFLNRSVSFVSF